MSRRLPSRRTLHAGSTGPGAAAASRRDGAAAGQRDDGAADRRRVRRRAGCSPTASPACRARSTARRRRRSRPGRRGSAARGQLLRRPSPGSTSADLLATRWSPCSSDGNAFIGKFRSEGSIIQLGLLDPQTVTVERRGAEWSTSLSRLEGFSEHGPEDIVHVKGWSPDGLRGLSTGARPRAKVLSSNAGPDRRTPATGSATPPARRHSRGHRRRCRSAPTRRRRSERRTGRSCSPARGRRRRRADRRPHRRAMSFERVEPPMKDSEFLAQRELAAREVARVFDLPPWALGGQLATASPTRTSRSRTAPSSITRCGPGSTRIERALQNDPTSAPAEPTSARLRRPAAGGPGARAAYYEAALERRLADRRRGPRAEDLPPTGGRAMRTDRATAHRRRGRGRAPPTVERRCKAHPGPDPLRRRVPRPGRLDARSSSRAPSASASWTSCGRWSTTAGVPLGRYPHARRRGRTTVCTGRSTRRGPART